MYSIYTCIQVYMYICYTYIYLYRMDMDTCTLYSVQYNGKNAYRPTVYSVHCGFVCVFTIIGNGYVYGYTVQCTGYPYTFPFECNVHLFVCLYVYYILLGGYSIHIRFNL